MMLLELEYEFEVLESTLKDSPVMFPTSCFYGLFYCLSIVDI